MKKRKILNSLIAMLLAIVMCVCSDTMLVNAANHCGFTYDTTYYDVYWKREAFNYVMTDDGELIGTQTYYRGILKEKGSNQYTLMLRMVMTPNTEKVKFLHGNKGYGFSEYLSVKVPVMDSIGSYEPKTTPSTNNGTLSFGVQGQTASIGMSFDITKSDIKINGKSDTPTRTFSAVYDYKPNFLPWDNNDYLRDESDQNAMVQFVTSREWFSLALTFDARFGVASSKTAHPLSVYLDQVYSNKKYADFYVNMNEFNSVYE